MTDFLMGPIPEGKDTGWTLKLNGKEVKDVALLELESKFGKLTYGLRPEGYDAWVFAESGGGGAITLPYCITGAREILVGLLAEIRPNMVNGADLKSLCAIGGFTDFGETAAQTQARELTEETGLDLKAKKMNGLPLNPNRAFFVTDYLNDKGVTCYYARIPENQLIRNHDDNCFVFDNPENLAFKKAAEVYFYPWREAICTTADALAVALIGRLVATLL